MLKLEFKWFIEKLPTTSITTVVSHVNFEGKKSLHENVTSSVVRDEPSESFQESMDIGLQLMNGGHYAKRHDTRVSECDGEQTSKYTDIGQVMRRLQHTRQTHNATQQHDRYNTRVSECDGEQASKYTDIGQVVRRLQHTRQTHNTTQQHDRYNTRVSECDGEQTSKYTDIGQVVRRLQHTRQTHNATQQHDRSKNS